ncbi:MAG: hypothetical protein IPL69_19725 [Saprospiraceae bacterium]|nr:hypothetical protein [Candidatus Brachybacter algidus]
MKAGVIISFVGDANAFHYTPEDKYRQVDYRFVKSRIYTLYYPALHIIDEDRFQLYIVRHIVTLSLAGFGKTKKFDARSTGL